MSLLNRERERKFKTWNFHERPAKLFLKRNFPFVRAQEIREETSILEILQEKKKKEKRNLHARVLIIELNPRPSTNNDNDSSSSHHPLEIATTRSTTPSKDRVALDRKIVHTRLSTHIQTHTHCARIHFSVEISYEPRRYQYTEYETPR